MTEKALSVIPKTVSEIMSLADLLSKSTMLPDALRGKSADIAVQVMAGAEIGLSPMAAIRGVHLVQGRPVLSADTMVGVVLGSGMAEYFICVDETATSVTYETRRRGSPKEQRCTWTIEDAKRAGLIKEGGNWAKYPRAMLKARAKAVLARDVYPDVLAGVYDPEEAREFAASPVAPPVNQTSHESETFDAEVIEQREADAKEAGASLLDRIASAPTIDDLEKLVPACNALPKDSQERTAARAAYQSRKAEFQTGATA